MGQTQDRIVAACTQAFQAQGLEVDANSIYSNGVTLRIMKPGTVTVLAELGAGFQSDYCSVHLIMRQGPLPEQILRNAWPQALIEGYPTAAHSKGFWLNPKRRSEPAWVQITQEPRHPREWDQFDFHALPYEDSERLEFLVTLCHVVACALAGYLGLKAAKPKPRPPEDSTGVQVGQTEVQLTHEQLVDRIRPILMGMPGEELARLYREELIGATEHLAYDGDSVFTLTTFPENP